MAKYFFDLRSADALSKDDVGEELSDVEAAHGDAVVALTEIMLGAVIQGASNQLFAVEVRDELGPVLEVAAVFRSKILRRQ